MKDYLSLDDIAEKLGVSTISLRRYVKSGRLKARQIGRAYRVSTDEAEAFIESFEGRNKAGTLEAVASISPDREDLDHKHPHHRMYSLCDHQFYYSSNGYFSCQWKSNQHVFY